MSDEAQVTMMLYSGLTPDEEAKLKSIESDVVAHVLSKHGNVRPFWQCVSSGAIRSIELQLPTRQPPVIWEVSADQLAAMAPSDVLAAIQQ